MKLQGLAIIFILIILPITIIIGEYANTQIQIFRQENLYDSRLVTATHDALKAFQINTFNDATSDIADSKISSIEASANAFYNSMQSSFGLQGYSKEDLAMYVPALVYTMYDGYYIYSPYTNIAEITEKPVENPSGEIDDNHTEKELTIDTDSNKIEYGFKPYVYYSCRYQMGTNSDFIINYSLDNYITIQGLVDGVNVYKSGYLLTIAENITDEGVYKADLLEGHEEFYYNGIKINVENNLTEILVEPDSLSTNEYRYVKLNGTKYYLNEKDDDGDGILDEYIFYLLGGQRSIQVKKDTNLELFNEYLEQIEINSNAVNYYKNAWEFTDWVNTNLSDLIASNAVSDISDKSDYKIFDNEHIEYSNSNFHRHRKDVIRFSIESNLSVAIANFNGYTNSGTNFQMPKLKETEWELLQNEVSIISFLQGLNLGGKIYNGYTVITNDKTEEVVKEERIYILTDDNYYHKINDEHFVEDNLEGATAKLGVLDLDFETRKDGSTGANYMHRIGLGCYTSIVGQENVNNEYDSIYEYLADNDDISDNIKQLYYTALGRERWSTYKIEKPSSMNTVLEYMEPDNNYSTTMVTDGLIRHLEANNADGFGNPLNSSVTIWRDLSDHCDGVVYGTPMAGSSSVLFDGNDDWVDLGNIEKDFNLNDKNEIEEITIEARVEFLEGTSPNSYILNNHESGGIGLILRNNKIGVSANINGVYSEIFSSSEIEYNTTYDISAVYDGNILKLYIYSNGSNETITLSKSGSIKIPANNTVMAIGVNPSGNKPEGVLAKINLYSIRIYNFALTEDEIAKNYDFGRMVKISNVEVIPEPTEWSNHGIDIKVTATTFYSSGINRIRYRIVGTGTWQDDWNFIESGTNGEWKKFQKTWNEEYNNVLLEIQAIAIDSEGNEKESDSKFVNLKNDLTKPEITNLQLVDDEITVEINEKYSGVEKIEYSYDNSTWQTEKWNPTSSTTVGEITTTKVNWDTLVDHGKTLYIRALDKAGNYSESKNILIVKKSLIEMEIYVDGEAYNNNQNKVQVGLKIGNNPVEYVTSYQEKHGNGTEWKIEGIKLEGVLVNYSATGIVGTDNKIIVNLYEMKFKSSNSTLGTVSKESLLVVNQNTTYNLQGEQVIINDNSGRVVTAQPKSSSIECTGWTESADGTITANFKQMPGLTISLYMDGQLYNNSEGRVQVNLRVGSQEKGYVTNYKEQHATGTSWTVNGIKIDGNSINYTASGTVGQNNIEIHLKEMKFRENDTILGTVSPKKLLVLTNTTYSTNGAVLTLNDGTGRTVTATPNSKVECKGWSETADGTIVANFAQMPTLAIKIYMDGQLYTNTSGKVQVGLKVGTSAKTFVTSHQNQYPTGTTWSVDGIKLDGTSVAYTASGTLTQNKDIEIRLREWKFRENDTSLGTVSPKSLLALNNTVLQYNGNVATINDGTGRTVTATPVNSSYELRNWTTASDGTIVANFAKIEVVSNGLYRYYDGVNNTGSGHSSSTTTWKDLSGHSNGTIEEGTWKSNAIGFDGGSGQVVCGTATRDIFDNGITVQMKITYYGDVTALFAYDDSGTLFEYGGVVFSSNDGNLGVKMYYSDSSSGYNTLESADNILVSGNTYNIAFTQQPGGQIKIYVDGVLKASTNSSGALWDHGHDDHHIRLNGEKWVWSSGGNGDKVDYHSVQIYTRALSEPEIKQNINATK